MKRTCFSLVVWIVVMSAAWAGVYEEGLEAKRSGQHERASTLLAQATREQPSNVEAWFHYGTVLGWLKRHDEALIALRSGLRRAPRDFDLRLAEARVLAWQADYAAAEERLDALDREFPNNHEVMVMQGRVAGWRKNDPKAQRIYEKILSQDPNQVDALTGLGDIHAARNHTAEARELFERAASLDPSPDVQQRLENLESMPKGKIYAGVTGSTFEREERDDWWSVYGTIVSRIESAEVWLRTEHGERFGFSDTTFELGATMPLGEIVRVTAFGGFTPEADFSAKGYGEVAVKWRMFEKLGPVGSGWLLTEGRFADYEPSWVTVTRLGWEQEIAHGWTFNARWLHLIYENGDSTDGWIGYISWEPKEGWYIRAGAAQSVESITSQTLRPGDDYRSWTLFGSLALPITKRLQLRIDYEREDVENSVLRHGGAVGFSYAF